MAQIYRESINRNVIKKNNLIEKKKWTYESDKHRDNYKKSK